MYWVMIAQVGDAAKVLNAAFMTYVAGAVASLMTPPYCLIIALLAKPRKNRRKK